MRQDNPHQTQLRGNSLQAGYATYNKPQTSLPLATPYPSSSGRQQSAAGRGRSRSDSCLLSHQRNADTAQVSGRTASSGCAITPPPQANQVSPTQEDSTWILQTSAGLIRCGRWSDPAQECAGVRSGWFKCTFVYLLRDDRIARVRKISRFPETDQPLRNIIRNLMVMAQTVHGRISRFIQPVPFSKQDYVPGCRVSCFPYCLEELLLDLIRRGYPAVSIPDQ